MSEEPKIIGPEIEVFPTMDPNYVFSSHATNGLRWAKRKRGFSFQTEEFLVLQRLWQNSNGTQEWRDVETVEEEK